MKIVIFLITIAFVGKLAKAHFDKQDTPWPKRFIYGLLIGLVLGGLGYLDGMAGQLASYKEGIELNEIVLAILVIIVSVVNVMPWSHESEIDTQDPDNISPKERVESFNKKT
ncbi:MAG: hypothetical protein K6L73_15010 [Cellvibrionaceae bacterium]